MFKKMKVGIVSIVFIFFSACSDKPVAELRIGTNIWPGYEPLYLAREKQFLSNDIKLVELSSATQVIQAYRNGVIDAAALTLDEVLLLLESGKQLSIVLVLDISNGADAIIAQKNINSLSDLVGKTIGMESTALGAYLLSRALTLANIPTSDINVKNIAVESHERAFINKEIDAIVTFEPIKSSLLARGANVIFDSKQIPNEIVDVLVIRNRKLI